MKYAILVLLLLLAACAPRNVEFTQYVGEEGISVEFAQNAPPEVVLEQQLLPVKIHVHNRGASDVPYEKMLFFFTYNPLYIQGDIAVLKPVDGDTGDPTTFLKGRSYLWPSGEDRTYKIPAEHSLTVKPVSGTIIQPETRVVANVCYAYNTLLTRQVCIDTSVYEENLRAQVCRQEDIVTEGGQGAPVTITLVEVQAVPVLDPVLQQEAIRPSFQIHLQNTGKGSVIGPPDLPMETACLLTGIPTDSLGAVYVDAWLLDSPLECTPNPVRLFADSGQTRCTVPMNELTDTRYAVKQNFESTLVVNATYLYSNSQEVPVAIERLRDPDLLEPIKDHIPGYVYEGGQIQFNALGSPLTYCEKYATEGGPEPFTNILSDWSCGCSQTECLKINRFDKGDRGCELTYGICPEPAYCCGAYPVDRDIVEEYETPEQFIVTEEGGEPEE